MELSESLSEVTRRTSSRLGGAAFQATAGVANEKTLLAVRLYVSQGLARRPKPSMVLPGHRSRSIRLIAIVN